MAISTSKLAPRIIINENDIVSLKKKTRKPPVTLMFGFSPIGRIGEMVVCDSEKKITNEFGFPESAPEKFFIDSGIKVVQNGGTAIMTRLPYDNFQSHNVKYVEYSIEKPIGIQDIVTGTQESKTRLIDDSGVTVLKEMLEIDTNLNQYQRIVQKKTSNGNLIGSMTNEELVEMELDPISNLDKNTFRIVDISGQQYGYGDGNIEYSGIFPVILTSPMALYQQNRIVNIPELDDEFNLLFMDDGIEMSTDWFTSSDPMDDNFKIVQSRIVSSINQDINFNSSKNKFHNKQSFQDICLQRFPLINLLQENKIDRKYLKSICVAVCRIAWDSDQQTTKLEILESFIGNLGRGIGGVDRKINSQSKYIRMYKNIQVPLATDYFVINNQKITSLGMQENECYKYINYKTSIIDPITFMLQSIYSDIDSLYLDVILDAGISSTAFAAYTAKTIDGESFRQNDKVRTRVDWSASEYNIDDDIRDYAQVWNEITKLFGDFIKTTRGDCVYIADGPRILNLERNYPIRNYTDMENIELFNKYLSLFNGNTTNYVARYFNWVFIEDLQYENQGFWVPGSVVLGGQIASSDYNSHVWYAVAGQQRGLIDGAYDVSVRTKQYNDENDILYQNQWNVFNIYQNEGVVVDGNKTLQTKKTSLDRLNVRRLICYIKQQARMIANRYKYEPNTESMREAFKMDLNSMLREIQRGSGISEYDILCDSTNNTISSIDRHELWCKIGVKPIKAIEYIVIDLNIMNGEVSITDRNTR